jgi:hypothetical protein
VLWWYHRLPIIMMVACVLMFAGSFHTTVTTTMIVVAYVLWIVTGYSTHKHRVLLLWCPRCWWGRGWDEAPEPVTGPDSLPVGVKPR